MLLAGRDLAVQQVAGSVLPGYDGNAELTSDRAVQAQGSCGLVGRRRRLGQALLALDHYPNISSLAKIT